VSLQFNKVILSGNLTRDVTLKILSGDRSVADFGLAINRRWKDANGEAKEDATFVDVQAWGRTADLCAQYLAKGRGCLVEGRLQMDTWEDKETGTRRSRLRVVAEAVQFTDSKPKDGAVDPTSPEVRPPRPDRPVTPPDQGEPPF